MLFEPWSSAPGARTAQETVLTPNLARIEAVNEEIFERDTKLSAELHQFRHPHQLPQPVAERSCRKMGSKFSERLARPRYSWAKVA
jgi:hypothetical protein